MSGAMGMGELANWFALAVVALGAPLVAINAHEAWRDCAAAYRWNGKRRVIARANLIREWVRLLALVALVIVASVGVGQPDARIHEAVHTGLIVLLSLLLVLVSHSDRAARQFVLDELERERDER